MELGAQDLNSFVKRDTLLFNPYNTYQLSSFNIIPGSETIVLRERLLGEGEYSVNYSKMSFSLHDTVRISIYDTLFVSYSSLIFTLKPLYYKRQLETRYDDKLKDTVQTLRLGQPVSIEESIFGKGMERSGSIYRGFTVGTNRDFSLQSGMRLELSGNLTEDILLTAALTDENSPIQPEGTTESLEEIDKVFIQLTHKNFDAVFGDYELNKRLGEFGNIKRKLQGLYFEGNSGNSSAYFGFAGAKGKFKSQSLTGLDGVQGPYRLTGLNNEREIIIIAGTERVYLDGTEIKRGEINQYTIDYAQAEITFNPSVIITSVSRITIDFEYSDRRYTRNTMIGGVQSEITKNIKIGMQYIREGDDQDAPIDLTFSESEKALLSNAGDNRLNAIRSGVLLAPADSLGNRNGFYTETDTTIAGTSYKIYTYKPDDPAAIYNVTFTYTGENLGDYKRAGVGNFYFAGINQGNYLPVIFLPLPALAQSGNFLVSFNSGGFVGSLELSGSLNDGNRYSSINDDDNGGYARNLSASYTTENFHLFADRGESVSVSLRERYIESRYISPDRLNTVEFERDFNLSGINKLDETLREVKGEYAYTSLVKAGFGYSRLLREDIFKTDRLTQSTAIRTEMFSLLSSSDINFSKTDYLNSNWYKQKVKGEVIVEGFTIALPLNFEDRRENSINTDSLNNSSFRFLELTPGISFSPVQNTTLLISYINRSDFHPVGGELVKESDSKGFGGELTLSGLREITSFFSIVYREKKFSEKFTSVLNSNTTTLLIKSNSRFSFYNKIIEGDVFYEGTTKRTAKPERVFIQVEKGSGNYRYRGDLNSNGIKDEGEYELTTLDGEYILLTVPSDDLFPVITLSFNPRVRINNWSILSPFDTDFFTDISSETIWRVEENSTLTEYGKIYLLDFSVFQNPLTTLRGTNFFQQDVYLFENNTDLSLRLRYNQRRSLNQFSGGTESAFAKELGGQISFKLIKEVSNLTEITTQIENLSSTNAVSRNRQISTDNFQTDFSYRPIRNLEAGLKLRVARSTDRYPVSPTIIDINSEVLRLVYSFSGAGRLRVELERIELLAAQTENYLPFELTGGNSLGKNYFFRLNFDYRIAANLQTTTYYEGRSLGGGRVINLAKSELRAFF